MASETMKRLTIKNDSGQIENKIAENWFELRLSSTAPDRRSYHSSFYYDNKMYVMGGLDIQNGSMSSLWELDLSSI